MRRSETAPEKAIEPFDGIFVLFSRSSFQIALLSGVRSEVNIVIRERELVMATALIV